MTPLQTAGFAHPGRNVDALGVDVGQTVVDFGSGSGAYVFAIAERLKGTGHVYAVDVQQDLLRRIKNESHKRGYKNVEIVWSDLEKPGGSKIADRHADLVVISNLLFQVEDKKTVLVEAWRILKPSGKLAIIDWSDSFGGMGPIKKDVVKKEMAVELARSAGFEALGEFKAGAHHYGMILRPVAHTA
jgi:ubiquinone/menaquinone biosynthesis C-methylase UbiE